MTLAAGFTLLVVGVTVFFIARDTVSPDVVLGAALVVLMGAGVIDVETAFSGFSNPALATIAALFIVAAGLRATDPLLERRQVSVVVDAFAQLFPEP